MILQHQNMSMESTTLLVIVLTTLLIVTQSSAQSSIPTEPTFFYRTCDPSYGNYTASSTYKANLTSVLGTLIAQSSIYRFYNASNGTVYGQYYCRGDIDPALCNDCILEASVVALVGCPNFKSAIIWYNVCSLRYRNESMFGVLDNNWYSYSSSPNNVSDPTSFSITLNSTLDTLITEAANSNDSRRLAVADVNASAFEKAYFLVQCSPDLSAADCETCLSDMDLFIPRCCGNWPVYANVFFASCQMSYSNSLFYTAPPSLSPPPQEFSPPPPPSDFLSPPPPPVTTSSPDGTTKASSEKVKVGVAVIFLALLTLQL